MPPLATLISITICELPPASKWKYSSPAEAAWKVRENHEICEFHKATTTVSRALLITLQAFTEWLLKCTECCVCWRILKQRGTVGAMMSPPPVRLRL